MILTSGTTLSNLFKMRNKWRSKCRCWVDEKANDLAYNDKVSLILIVPENDLSVNLTILQVLVNLANRDIGGITTDHEGQDRRERWNSPHSRVRVDGCEVHFLRVSYACLKVFPSVWS